MHHHLHSGLCQVFFLAHIQHTERHAHIRSDQDKNWKLQHTPLKHTFTSHNPSVPLSFPFIILFLTFCFFTLGRTCAARVTCRPLLPPLAQSHCYTPSHSLSFLYIYLSTFSLSPSGSCVCGECHCNVGWTGTACDQELGCDNKGGKMDLCGVCNGNETSCMGECRLCVDPSVLQVISCQALRFHLFSPTCPISFSLSCVELNVCA